MEGTQSAAALVVRNIGDIESALAQAHLLGEDLWEAVRELIRDTLPADWHVSDFDDDEGKIWFSPKVWLIPDEDETDADPWFTIEPVAGPSGDYDETYLAEFLGVGPNGAAIAVYLRSTAMQKSRFRKQLLVASNPNVEALQRVGFQLDDKAWLHMPLKLDADAVAQGADDEDYAQALRPLKAVLEVTVANLHTFAALTLPSPAETA